MFVELVFVEPMFEKFTVSGSGALSGAATMRGRSVKSTLDSALAGSNWVDWMFEVLVALISMVAFL